MRIRERKHKIRVDVVLSVLCSRGGGWAEEGRKALKKEAKDERNKRRLRK